MFNKDYLIKSCSVFFGDLLPYIISGHYIKRLQYNPQGTRRREEQGILGNGLH
jgi:hypothetical protein